MYERNLKDELFACHMYVKIPFDVLEKMPIMDRKYYINKYIEYVNARNDAMNNGGSSTSNSNISNYTSMSQGLDGDDIAEEMGLIKKKKRSRICTLGVLILLLCGLHHTSIFCI